MATLVATRSSIDPKGNSGHQWDQANLRPTDSLIARTRARPLVLGPVVLVMAVGPEKGQAKSFAFDAPSRRNKSIC
jgi:hypothetical protein